MATLTPSPTKKSHNAFASADGTPSYPLVFFGKNAKASAKAATQAIAKAAAKTAAKAAFKVAFKVPFKAAVKAASDSKAAFLRCKVRFQHASKAASALLQRLPPIITAELLPQFLRVGLFLWDWG